MDKDTSTENRKAAMRVECLDFVENKDWRKNHPTGPVTWDAWCSICGFKLEDKPFASGMSIEGEGRKLAFVSQRRVIDGEIFESKKRWMVCSVCCPNIK